MDRAIPTNKSTSKNNNSPRSIRQYLVAYCKKRDIKRWSYHVCTNSFYCCKNKIKTKVPTKAKYFVIMGEALRLTRDHILSMYNKGVHNSPNLCQHTFWHYENRLIKTIKTRPHNLCVSLKSRFLYFTEDQDKPYNPQ